MDEFHKARIAGMIDRLSKLNPPQGKAQQFDYIQDKVSKFNPPVTPEALVDHLTAVRFLP
jgi:hypothetical protein